MNKLGRFYISHALINDLRAGKGNMDAINETFRGMFIVQINDRWDTGKAEYLAFCEEFEELPDGQMAPEYEIIIHTDYDDKGVPVEYRRELVNRGYQ